jgi:hypothetical protein
MYTAQKLASLTLIKDLRVVRVGTFTKQQLCRFLYDLLIAVSSINEKPYATTGKVQAEYFWPSIVVT